MKELMAKIEAKKAEIEAKQKEIEGFELDIDDYVEQYEEALNSEGLVTVGGLTFEPATIIRELDPVAYSCGLNDYVDGIEKEENEDYKDLLDELEALEDELTDLENELEEKEEE